MKKLFLLAAINKCILDYDKEKGLFRKARLRGDSLGIISLKMMRDTIIKNTFPDTNSRGDLFPRYLTKYLRDIEQIALSAPKNKLTARLLVTLLVNIRQALTVEENKKKLEKELFTIGKHHRKKSFFQPDKLADKLEKAYSHNEEASDIQRLPEEMWLHILSFFSNRVQLNPLQSVCKKFHQFANDKTINTRLPKYNYKVISNSPEYKHEFILSTSLSPVDDYVAFSDFSGLQISLFNFQSGKEIERMSIPETGCKTGICFSKEGDRLFLVDNRGQFVVWQLQTSKVIQSADLGFSSATIQLLSLSNGDLIVSGYNHLFYYQVSACNKISIQTAERSPCIKAIAISRDEKTLLVSSQRGYISVYCIETKELLKIFDVDFIVLDFKFLGSKHFVCGGENTLEIWNIASEKKIHAIDVENQKVNLIALSNDQKYLAVSTAKDKSGENTILIYETDHYNLINELSSEEAIQFLSFTQAGDKILYSTVNTFSVIEFDPVNAPRLM